MKHIERGDLRPGVLVEHRTRFLVTTKTYGSASQKHAGRHKFVQLGEVEQVVVGTRWRVCRVDLHSLGMAPYWIAVGGELDEDGRDEWTMFDTHAEAIAYADRRAREVCMTTRDGGRR